MSNTPNTYYKHHRAKKRDQRSATGPFIHWTPPEEWGVPLALFREPDGILMVSPDLLPPETLAALPPVPTWDEEDGEIIGHLNIKENE
jgi:hypothetical protein